MLVEVAGAGSGGAEPGGEEPGGAEPAGVEPGGAEPEGVEPGGAESEGAASGGAEPQGAASSGGPSGALPRLSPQQLREWLIRRARLRTATDPGGARTRGTGAAGTGGVGGAGSGDPTEPGAAGAGGFGAGGVGAGGARAVDPGAGGAGAGGAGGPSTGGPVRPRPCFVPLLQQVLGVPSSNSLPSPLLCPPLDQWQPLLQPASPLPAPSPYTEQSSALRKRREPASRPVLFVRTARRAPCPRPPPVPGTHAMALRPSSVPLRVPLPAPPESSLPEDRQEDFECLAAAVPRFASMLLAPEGDPDAPNIPTPRSYAEAITGPYSSQWQAAMDGEMASWKSTGTYVDTVPPSRTNIVDGMWIFRGSLHEEIWLRRPLGFTGSFPAGTHWSLQRPVYGLRQAPHEWNDTLRTTLAALGFAPSTADPSLFLRTDTSLPPFYDLMYINDLVFATADTEALALVKSGLQKRHTCTDLGPLALRFPVILATAQSSVYRPLALSSTFGRVRRAEWSIPRACGLPHVPDDLHTTRPCVPSQPSGLLRGSRTSGMGLVLGGRGPVVLTGHADASWVDESATQRSSQGYTFSLGSGSMSWRSTRSSSVLSSSCEAEIYAGAMATQELRWLTLEHRTKHIALRYFLARELQQRGQLCLAYVATRANNVDIFTTALPPGDHQRFATVFYLTYSLLDFACTVIYIYTYMLTLARCGDCVIHPELALLFLTGLVTTCSPPLCLSGVAGAFRTDCGFDFGALEAAHLAAARIDISHKIMLHGLSNFNEILALAEKIDILRRPRPGATMDNVLEDKSSTPPYTPLRRMQLPHHLRGVALLAIGQAIARVNAQRR
ncbi:unnamed protein product [Closterium sp. NIES-53]